jgi:hypothetical protein
MGEMSAAATGELDRDSSTTGHGGDSAPPESAEDDGLDAVLAPRSPRRRRILQLASALVALGIVVGLVANSFAPLRSLPTLLFPPTATADPSLISTVTVTSAVTWGTFTLNGKKISGSLPLHITLRPGDNTLTFSAPPFLPRTCHVTAPLRWERPDTNATCGLGYAGPSPGCPSTAAPGECVNGTFRQILIEFAPTADDLPPDLRQSAVAYLRQTLGNLASFTTSVPRGDYVATGIDSSGRAILSQPAAEVLTAELTVGVDVRESTDGAPFGVSNASSDHESQCATLRCSVPNEAFGEAQPPPGWRLAIPVIFTWRFTSATGALTGSIAVAAPGFLNVSLTYDEQTGWQLAAPRPALVEANIPSLLCVAGTQALAAVLPARPLGITNNSGQSLRGIEGCSLQFQAGADASQGLVVWRFGVLLAADAATQKPLPSLPLAPPDEVKAVGV